MYIYWLEVFFLVLGIKINWNVIYFQLDENEIILFKIYLEQREDPQYPYYLL